MAALERGVGLIDDSPSERGGSHDPGTARGEIELRDVSAALPRRPAAGAGPAEPARPARRDGGAGRPVGRRQVDAGATCCRASSSPAPAACCSTACRWPTGTSARCAASSRWSARTWCCSTTAWPPTWRWAAPTPMRPRARARRAAQRQPARLRRRPAAGPGHADRPQRQPALGRPAPAPGDRARDLQGRADPDPRRGHLGARQRIRARGAGGARPADAGPHHARHRAPAVDHRARRPRRGARRRAASSSRARTPSCWPPAACMRDCTRMQFRS